jgi:membrane protein DedA with SNARE-associated domain
MERLRNGLGNAALPLCLSLFVLTAGLAHRVLPVPSFTELFAALQAFYREYGVPALLVAAFLEGIFLLSFYIPGSLVIVLGVILSADDPQRLIAIGFACWIGVNLAMVADYAIGRYGLYRLFAGLGATAAVASTERWMKRFGRAAILVAAVHPNLLSLIMVYAGIARAPLLGTLTQAAAATAGFIPLSVIIVWLTLRNTAIEETNPLPVALGLLLLWSAVLFIRGYRGKDCHPRIGGCP